jgi:hypothetical protein
LLLSVHKVHLWLLHVLPHYLNLSPTKTSFENYNPLHTWKAH